MKSLITLILTIIIFVSCGQSSSDSFSRPQNSFKNYEVKIHTYDSSPIPLFIAALLRNHISDYAALDSIAFQEFSRNNNLDPYDKENIKKFYSIRILHDLFTSQTASNCSKGEILNIPYQWHWVNPNPRHTIRLTENGKLLKDTKAPAEFAKYNSYADIDRTPYLFLSDLFSEKPKYYSASCDTFPTFGWCSEREMAFVCLLHLLNYSGKVVAEGNHSWSELLIPLKSADGKLKNFRVVVDNTFNGLNWEEIKDQDAETWKKYFGDSALAGWYNQKAHSSAEKQKINAFIVSEKVSNKIEIRLVEYLKKISPR
jgi:hypothetical protein